MSGTVRGTWLKLLGNLVRNLKKGVPFSSVEQAGEHTRAHTQKLLFLTGWYEQSFLHIVNPQFL